MQLLQSGPELRQGSVSITATGNLYDGGFTSAGVFGFYTAPTNVWVTGSGPDEPDAVWNITWDQATYVDHGAVSANAVLFLVYPVLADKRIEMNVEVIDSSIESSVNVPGSGSAAGEFDGNYLFYHGTIGIWLTRRCRFGRNAADGTSGQGGIRILPPGAGSLTPIMVFEDSEWTDNLSAFGPAIFVFYGQVDLQFRRCYFRCDTVPALSRRSCC